MKPEAASPSGRRWELAPQMSRSIFSDRVMGIWLRPGERVRWKLLEMPDGTREVIGYTLISRANA